MDQHQRPDPEEDSSREAEQPDRGTPPGGRRPLRQPGAGAPPQPGPQGYAAPSGPQPAGGRTPPGGQDARQRGTAAPSGPQPPQAGAWFPEGPVHGRGTPPGGVRGEEWPPRQGPFPPAPYAVEPPGPHEPTGPNQATWAGPSGPQRPPAAPGDTPPRAFAQDSVAEAFLSGTPMPAPQPQQPPEPPRGPQRPRRYGPPSGPQQPQPPQPPQQPWRGPASGVPPHPSAAAAPPAAPPVAPPPGAPPARPPEPPPQEPARGQEPSPPPERRKGGTPARAWFGTPPPADTSRPREASGQSRGPRKVGPPRPADPPTVSPGGEEDAHDPDAEETDVFLVLSADRRARKEREEKEEGEGQEDPGDEDSPVHRNSPTPAPAAGEAAPSPAAPEGGPTPGPRGSQGVTAAPQTGTKRPEQFRGTLGEGPPGPPDASVRSGLTQPESAQPESAVSGAPGIESWIEAANDGHTPVPGGYEQRIAAVKRIPASPWRRAVFAATGGRLNLG